MVPAFITQRVAHEPKVLLLGRKTSLVRELQHALQRGGSHVSLKDHFSGYFNESTDEWYRVIWALQPEILSLESEAQTLASLARFGSRALVVFLVPTAANGSSWSNHSLALQQLITECSYRLPEASFVFGLDVVSAGSAYPTTPLPYFFEQRGVVDPRISLHLQTEEEFSTIVAEQIFRPTPSPSVLVQGTAMSSKNVVRELEQKMYAQSSGGRGGGRQPWNIIEQPATLVSPIPFSVQKRRSRSDVSGAIDKFVHEGLLDVSRKPKSHVEQKPVVEEKTERKATIRDQDTKPAPVVPKSPPALKTKEAQEEDFDLSSELQAVFSTTRSHQKARRVVSKTRTEKKVVKKSKRKRVLFYGGLATIGMGLGVLFLAGFFTLSQIMVRGQLEQVISLSTDSNESSQMSEKEWKKLAQYTDVLAFQTESYGAFLDIEPVDQAVSLVEMSMLVQDTADRINQVELLTQQLVSLILGSGTGDVRAITQQLTSQSQQLYQDLSLVQAALDEVRFYSEDSVGEPGAEIENTDDEYAVFEERLSELRKALIIAQQVQPIIPPLLGEEGRRTYALLLQNNQEQRATGGFIQAVAILTFEQGSLISTDVYSSDELDKQLRGSIQPPEDLERFLGEERWWLHDGNWDPHFPQTAAQMVQFIEMSRGAEVDGVIAMNLTTLQAVLAATGPLDVPEYNEVVTDKNIFERMEFHSEAVLVENNTTMDYSTVILQRLLRKLSGLSPDKTKALIAAGYSQLQNQELLISSQNLKEQEALSSLGWTGALVGPDCPAQLSAVPCQVSTLSQIESNIGANKANYYVETEVLHEISLSPTAADHMRKIKFTNTASSNSWPKGAYNTYIRFYIDSQAEIESLTINGRKIGADELVFETAHQKRYVGVELVVPIQQSRELVLSYSVPIQEEAQESDFSYVFFEQRQPGALNLSSQVMVNVDPSLSPTVVAPQASVVGGTITYLPNDDGHTLYGVQVEQ